MNPVVLPWLAEIGIITYRTMTGQRFTLTTSGGVSGFGVVKGSGPKRPPLPSELLSTFIVFGAYSLIGTSGNSDMHRVAALLGWGTVLATILVMTGSPQSASQQTAAASKSTAPATASKGTS